MRHWICYYRVSTDKQGRSGLGLDAQRSLVAGFLQPSDSVLASYTEVESGRKASNRPELAKAIAHCQRSKARLLVASLDRIARDAHFILGLSKVGVDFTIANNPNVNRLTVGILAIVAEEESRLVSERTRLAIAQCKARGKQWGKHGAKLAQMHKAQSTTFAQSLKPVLAEIQEFGINSVSGICAELNRRNVQSRNGGKWHPTQVQRVLKRLGQ